MEILSVLKAVRLLEALAREPEPQGVTELARQLGMDKSTVSRMLRTLESVTLVAQDGATRRYALGLGLVNFGQTVLRRLDLRAIGEDSLVALVQKTGECVHLAVLSGDRALYIAQKTSGLGVNVDAPVGTLAPLHCTALGKVLLAFRPEKEREAFLSKQGLEPFTRRTITDPTALRIQLDLVRMRHLAFDDEEFSVGIRCIAAPVFRHDCSVAGALGISATSPRLNDHRIHECEEVLRAEAYALSRKIGWMDDSEISKMTAVSL